MDRSSSDVVVRAASRSEVDQVVAWAAEEGWNPGLGDADCFHAADPRGFLLAVRDAEPVASISVVRYGEAFGFLGLYIVRPDLRGRGHGYRLWQAGMARLSGRTVGLDGVVAQQENYRKSGFSLAHRNIRYGGQIKNAPPRDARILKVEGTLLDAVVAYDRAFFPAPRETFLRCWLAPDQRRARTLLEDGAIRSYGVIRRCRTGFKVGPLFAETEEDADILFRSLAADADGAPVFLDVPEPNAAAQALASRHGLAPVFETARMYRGPDPGLPLPRIFGITTLELG
jgi:GNAT acetyltransferase-like protein/acetyltransferase (GNAT) family protein